jgi:hypothetical protein
MAMPSEETKGVNMPYSSSNILSSPTDSIREGGASRHPSNHQTEATNKHERFQNVWQEEPIRNGEACVLSWLEERDGRRGEFLCFSYKLGDGCSRTRATRSTSRSGSATTIFTAAATLTVR